jgi:hypothetical protein
MDIGEGEEVFGNQVQINNEKYFSANFTVNYRPPNLQERIEAKGEEKRFKSDWKRKRGGRGRGRGGR